ncbi:MAG: 23S rRNA pseudouridine(955/2504/2580) synthase RluC [Pseudomonadales bacterium]|nr:23S rRNA pseudouridine(955/2504/2580) synthase RluC [Pseudomonadales bacterium]
MTDSSASASKNSSKGSGEPSSPSSAPRVSFNSIDENSQGQRIDNYLLRTMKGVPKSRIYRALRKGEVRVNKKRIKPEFKLSIGDSVRIPPIMFEESAVPSLPGRKFVALLESRILYEDDLLLAVNKPTGVAVHGGSGIQLGLIEALRSMRSQCGFLELVHRIDKDTSGCLLIAKKRGVLLDLHRQLREGGMHKQYTALLDGRWSGREHLIDAPLKKNVLASGERHVRVAVDGKASKTLFHVEKRYQDATLVVAKPITGRTHQIRVHAQFVGHAILGDQRYALAESNQRMKKLGLKRLFLHAHSLAFTLPGPEDIFRVEAPLDADLQKVLDVLEKGQ